VAYLWIALGAVVGASARYFLSGFIAKVFPSGFPYGTLIINIMAACCSGSFSFGQASGCSSMPGGGCSSR
jgi:fluoride exporter